MGREISQFDVFLNEMIERTDLGGKGSELELGAAVESVYKWLKSRGSEGVDPSDLEEASNALVDTKLMSRAEADRVPVLVLELAEVLSKFAKLTPTQVGGVCGLVQTVFYDPEREADAIVSVDDEPKNSSPHHQIPRRFRTPPTPDSPFQGPPAPCPILKAFPYSGIRCSEG